MDQNDKLAPHIEDITRVLGNDISVEEVENELLRYTKEYMVPLNEAKRSIVKKFGGNPIELGLGVEKTIDKLNANESTVDLLCRIVSVNPKEVKVKGEPKQIFFGFLGDQTGTISYTAWSDFGLSKGDVVRIKGAYTKAGLNGEPQVNLGDRVRIRKESADALPPLSDSRMSSEYKIAEFKEGRGGVTVKARILQLEEKEIVVEDEKKTIFKGLLGDVTGKSRFTAWTDFKIKEGDVVKISGGYIKTWRGIPELSFDARSDVEHLADDDLPPMDDLLKNRVMNIDDLQEKGGATGVVILGVVLDIRNGSGLIMRCPQCNRVLQREECMVHGKQDGTPDLRTKAVLDDGTGAISVILGKEITEKVLERDIDSCMAQAKEHMSTEVIKHELEDRLIANHITVGGNVTSDDFGLMLLATDLSFETLDVVKEAQALLSQLEV